MNNYYIIIDIGTGNSRTALVSADGKIIRILTFENTYYKDTAYDDALYFLPEEWRNRIFTAIKKITGEYKIAAVTATGARQSIVLYDRAGNPFMGIPNTDHRGNACRLPFSEKEEEYIYEKTGKWDAKSFPAAKLAAVKEYQPEIYGRISKITSVSEWLAEIFTGEIVTEPSQACETQLFDIQERKWSDALCGIYGIAKDILPEIMYSGNSPGKIKPDTAEELGLPDDAVFIIGGADTQTAVKFASPKINDITVISGTTSPVIAKAEATGMTRGKRCWIDCDLGNSGYLTETNPGKTGLNYQNFKKHSYPGTTYEQLDDIISKKTGFNCIASFSSLDFAEPGAGIRRSIVSLLPDSASPDQADIVKALLADTVCSVYRQYDILANTLPDKKDYVLCCGGGFRSKVMGQMFADITRKKVILYEGYEQASVLGCAKICSEYFHNRDNAEQKTVRIYIPKRNREMEEYYREWTDRFRK